MGDTAEAETTSAGGVRTEERRRRGLRFWRRADPKPKRSVLRRLFGLKLLGALQLLAICILVGFVMLLANFNPAQPGFDATNALEEVIRNSVAGLQWAAVHFWKPALAGATVVLPVWVLWRLATLPFRR